MSEKDWFCKVDLGYVRSNCAIQVETNLVQVAVNCRLRVLAVYFSNYLPNHQLNRFLAWKIPTACCLLLYLTSESSKVLGLKETLDMLQPTVKPMRLYITIIYQ